MNVSEMSDGVKIALTLVMICIIIAIVFGIVRFVKGQTDEGTATLENSVMAMSDTEFDAYDNKIRTGSQVASLIQLYKNRDIGIMVETKKGTTVNYARMFDGNPSVPAANPNTQVMESTVQSFIDPEEFNINLTNSQNAAHDDFIRSSAKFDSYLIKDAGEQTVGVYFIQK